MNIISEEIENSISFVAFFMVFSFYNKKNKNLKNLIYLSLGSTLLCCWWNNLFFEHKFLHHKGKIYIWKVIPTFLYIKKSTKNHEIKFHDNSVSITRIKMGLSWPWSYGSWIYNYLFNQCLSPLKLWVWALFNARYMYTRYNIIW